MVDVSTLGMSDLIARLWRRVQPPELKILGGHFLGLMPSSLSERERQSLGEVTQGRASAFAMGRHFARALCSEVGVQNAEVLKHALGFPIWPDGVVGSISHVLVNNIPFVVVAGGSTQHFQSIGVDIEYDFQARIPEISYWLKLNELNELAEIIDVPHLTLISNMWVSKEACAKALDCPPEWLERIELRPRLDRGVLICECLLDNVLQRGLIVKSLSAGSWVFALAWKVAEH